MIKLFFSYSHRDEMYRDELAIHLAMLERQGVIETWHDRRIAAGDEIHAGINEHLEAADIILLLISPHFLASNYCYDVEMNRALERQENAKARVIPVIIHPCDWQHPPLSRLRATPTDGKPISKHTNIHDAFLVVAEDIRNVAKKFLDKKTKEQHHTERAKSQKEQPDIESDSAAISQSRTEPRNDESQVYESLIVMLFQNIFKNRAFSIGASSRNIDEVWRRKKYPGKSGQIHEIDVSFQFELSGIDFLVLIECKCQRRRVTLADILSFRSRIEDIGAQKGIIVATSGFQKSAKDLAEAHRIALILFSYENLIVLKGYSGTPSLFEQPSFELVGRPGAKEEFIDVLELLSLRGD